MEKEKRMGPRTEPCGIPIESWRVDEEDPLKDTLKEQLERWENHKKTILEAKVEDKISRRGAWSTVSKVADR